MFYISAVVCYSNGSQSGRQQFLRLYIRYRGRWNTCWNGGVANDAPIRELCHVHCTRIDYKWISFRFGFFRRSQFFYFFSYFCSSVFRRLFIFYTKSNFSSAKYSQVACVAVGRSRVPKLIDYFYFLFLTSCTAQNIIKHNKLVPWTYATHIAQHTRVDAYSGTY